MLHSLTDSLFGILLWSGRRDLRPRVTRHNRDVQRSGILLLLEDLVQLSWDTLLLLGKLGALLLLRCAAENAGNTATVESLNAAVIGTLLLLGALLNSLADSV